MTAGNTKDEIPALLKLNFWLRRHMQSKRFLTTEAMNEEIGEGGLGVERGGSF